MPILKVLINIYTCAGSIAWADWVLVDAVELTHSRVFSCHKHGLGQEELPIQWYIRYIALQLNSNYKILREIWNPSTPTYLLVLLSTSSQRSSATRKTDFRLMGREMEWTRPSSTSSTSSWFLHTQTQAHDQYHRMTDAVQQCCGRSSLDRSSLPVFLIKEKPVFVGEVTTHFMPSLRTKINTHNTFISHAALEGFVQSSLLEM